MSEDVSQKKITPGPWRAIARDIGGECDSWAVYADSGNASPQIANVHIWDGADDEANARAISAVPDMMHALEILIKELEGRGRACGTVAAREIAREALRKAKGRYHV